MKPDVKKIIADIKATKGNRKFCNGLAGTLQDDNYASSICKYVKTVTPERIDLLIEYAEKLEAEVTDMAVQLANAESKCRELAAENGVKQEFIKTCFRAAADGGSMDGDDIQKLGERLGLFGREIYQPVLHGYICGHEAGEDTVYVMKKTPATDAFLAEVRACTLDEFAKAQDEQAKKYYEISPGCSGQNECQFAAGQALYYAECLRKGAAQ
ncbi:hypothetical protein LT989_10800 [Citrobacter portucalensis]|uniref:hypothetical protein n=1 Tax=Citrobacter portucalensis TaxID=1639133 RepID=UPI000F8E16EA|nr:hypothetical protein [Citrobacter portucalensis]MEB0790596.1 hypothetical protein [Citrobacter portucalensis]MEB0874322.1 hypothetical protein [Citrobacter portucalensis]RUR35941.1 hypothetical protein EKO26_23875 [Citrobacter portucalensis]UHD39082.1 hypothetical protein LT989_10800 [Citrobacter portucalensis]